MRGLQSSFAAKLLSVVGASALAFVLIIAVSSLLGARTQEHLTAVEQHHLPRLELGHRLENHFERLREGFQDAVAAQDGDALRNTRAVKDAILGDLGTARAVVNSSAASELRTALEDYYQSAYDVSTRLIAGEAGERLVESVAAMQSKLTYTRELVRKIGRVEESELSQAFRAIRDAQATAAQVRLSVSIVCFVLVLMLSLWVLRGVLRTLGEVSSGFERFAKGDFAQPIAVLSRDELGQLAEGANRMARSLDALGRERQRSDWINAGLAGLSKELRGDLAPAETAKRAIRFLARYLDAPAAALYYRTGGDTLTLLGQCATTEQAEGGPAQPVFRLGEGLVGQAALHDEITVVTDVPSGHLRVRSGLGESAPCALSLAPLVHSGNVRGVVEFAVFKPWTDQQSQLLRAVHETLAIAVEVALARSALQEALAEAQRLAERLRAQEEELRAINEELQTQQEELRHANDELRSQAEELETRQVEIEQSNVELAEARERLERKAEELATVSTYKSQFLANMSHELRTPLNSMLLLSDLLAQNEQANLTDKQVEYCRTIYGAGRDLLALINQVLDLAKIEAGKQEAKLELVPVGQLGLYAQRIFAPLAREKGLELAVEIASGAPDAIRTDRQRTEQILNNLLGNAIKFTERGTVKLRIGPPEPGIRLQRADLSIDRVLALAVSDTGIGIAPEHKSRVFAPFEQVEGRSNRRYGGTGLGLSIARELAALLGGELQLRSELGKGSTFTLFLPLDVRDAAAGRPASTTSVGDLAEPAPAAAERTRTNGHDDGAPDLLLIEDDPAFSDSVSEIVREQGLRCIVANDGQTGLRLAKQRRPRGIILDVKLPDFDGFQVMESLRADPATSTIPVHFVSAIEAAERGLALGAVGYLTKPATRHDLARVVESLVPKLGNRQGRVLIVEDDADVAKSLAQRLRGEDFETHSVGSARSALEALSSERFHCMILDLSLPDMDGLAFLESLQRQGAVTPPVVVYTARALSKAETQRLEAYAEAIVLKEGPSADRLLDEVRLFARRLRAGLPPGRRTRMSLPPASVRLSGVKVLLADDDMRTVYALSALLRARGAEVVVADTGLAALAMLERHPDIGIVLMDIMMPEMDGYDAMRRIRAQARFAQLPIVALTAKAMKGDREQCLEAGASDYLPKPIDPDALLAILHDRLKGDVEHAE